MGPSEALVETLAANGVTHVFGIVGSAFMDALDIFPAAGIQFVPVAHEQGAIHMADGYARASGRHGVCIAQNGPGVTNFVTGVAAAYWAHSPVVFITPETGSMTMGLGGFQETEQLPIFSKITKYQGHVNNPRRMAEIAARCFDRAMLEAGPAQLNIPRDFFYGDIEASIAKPMLLRHGPGDAAALDAAAELLCGASFPVIVAGGGVITAGATAEAIELADLLGAAVCNSYLHNDSFPASHPLAAGPLGYQGSKAAEKTTWEAELRDWTHERDAYSLEVAANSGRMHPREVLRALEQAMPADAMVSTDIGNICSVANSYLRFERPRSMFAAMSFGNCGYAFPVICGAKLASPERPAFAYVGDGAWGISFNELLTCARESIGVTVVVFNNAQWGSEKKNHVDFYSRRYQGVNLQNPSWAAVARAFGCEGVTVERLADVGPALRAAAAAPSAGRT